MLDFTGVSILRLLGSQLLNVHFATRIASHPGRKKNLPMCSPTDSIKMDPPGSESWDFWNFSIWGVFFFGSRKGLAGENLIEKVGIYLGVLSTITQLFPLNLASDVFFGIDFWNTWVFDLFNLTAKIPRWRLLEGRHLSWGKTTIFGGFGKQAKGKTAQKWRLGWMMIFLFNEVPC